MSRETLDQFAQEAIRNGELLIGSRDGDITEFTPLVTSSGSRDVEGRLIVPDSAIFATRSLQVAIFAGSVWSRDGWSGWHSYRDDHCLPYHEFYASPYVLRDALEIGGYVYKVPSEPFEPGPIPGEYIAKDAVPAAGPPRPCSIYDMNVRIAEAAYLPRREGRKGFDDPPNLRRLLPQLA